MQPGDLLLSVLVALALAVLGGQACKFRDHEVIPQVIDEAPTKVLNVSYPNGKTASYGNELTPTEVKDMPKVQADVDKEKYYTLAFMDPDVPSRKNPENGQWLHWLVMNIPGSSLKDGDLSAGHTLAEYVGSAPPEGSGLHRYIYLLYEQSGTIEPKEKTIPATSTQGRPKFTIRDFAKEKNLNLAAGNFYLAQYDDYVPKIYETFKD